MTFAEVPPGPPAIEPTARPIQVDLYESDNITLVGRLATDIAGSRSWTDVLNELGDASLTVPLWVPAEDWSEMIPNSEAYDLTRGRVLRFSLDGEDRFAAVIRPRRQTSVTAAQLDAGTTRTVRCRGLLSEWDQAVMPPAPGAELFPGGDVRHFGWMSKEAVVSSMSAPTISRPVFADGYPHPEPWVDAFGGVFSAATHRYFIHDQTLATETAVSVHMAFGDQGTVWLNGVPMGSGAQPPDSSWGTTRHGGALLPAGTHRWAFEIEGLPGAAEPRWTATCFEVNDATTGQMRGDTILWRTGYEFGSTPYPWKASATPVGPTVKQIIRSVLGHVQSEQGRLLDWELYGGDDTVDANGNPLDGIAHLPVQIGSKLASGFLMQLAKSWCDLAVPPGPGKVLKVYRWRERGTFATSPSSMPTYSDARFAPVEGRLANVLSLTHEERDS